MQRDRVFFFGASALVLLLLLGATWLERPALGLAMGSVVSCSALVLFSIQQKPRGRTR